MKFSLRSTRTKLALGAAAGAACVALVAGPAFADGCITFKATPSGCTQQTVTGTGGQSGSYVIGRTSIPGTAICLSKPPVELTLTINGVKYFGAVYGNSIDGKQPNSNVKPHTHGHRLGTTWYYS